MTESRTQRPLPKRGSSEQAAERIQPAMISQLDCAGRMLDLTHPQVMGVLNVTPDSFSDGGQHAGTAAALDWAAQMAEEGAAIIDVGGESTRPGAEPVPVDQELERVVPVVEGIVGAGLDVIVSVDTSKPEVMRAATAAGAGMVNDIRALALPGALEAVRDAAVPVCLMHMQGAPRTMQAAPQYTDVVQEVKAFLRQRAERCIAAGIGRERLLVDPGIGFGKELRHNLLLLRHLQELAQLDLPILVGLSRKRMIGTLLGGAPVDQRLYGSVAGAAMAAWLGAAVVRVHDVRATVEALKICDAVRSAD